MGLGQIPQVRGETQGGFLGVAVSRGVPHAWRGGFPPHAGACRRHLLILQRIGTGAGRSQAPTGLIEDWASAAGVLRACPGRAFGPCGATCQGDC